MRLGTKQFLRELLLALIVGLLGAFLIVGFSRLAAGQDVYRDRGGRIQLRSSQSGGTTTFRDSSGKKVATASQSGKTVTYRDAYGRTITKQSTPTTQPVKPSPVPVMKGKK